ncbi:MAG: PAS domain-containing sensor histidine kinase [Elusimicrobiota bacterium]
MKLSKDIISAMVDVIGNISEGIVVTNKEGIIEYVNPAFENITGHKSYECEGESINILKSNKQRESFYEHMWKTINKNEIWKGNIINKKKDGSYYYEEMTIIPVKNLKSKTQKYVAIKHDITERVNFEKTLIKKNKELKEIVKTKNWFINLMAHELRTPLTSLKGSLSLMLGGAFGEVTGKFSEYINICYRNTERLIRLVNDYLDFSKTESDSLDMNMRYAEIQDAVNRVIKEMETALKDKKIEVEYNIANECPSLYFDYDRITQVLYNLMSNAAKFSPEGALIKIETKENDGYIETRILDEAKSISKDRREIIFNKFVQLQNKDEKGEGSGLGLAIAKAIVQQHNGRIWVEPREDKGNEFIFRLPIEKRKRERL